MDFSKFLENHLAKSDGTTIKDHIEDLLYQYEILNSLYPELLSEEEREALKLAIHYHDYGKLNKLFQCKLPINKKLKPVNCFSSVRDDIVPHQFLSPLFLRKEFKTDHKTEKSILAIYSIINHHSRGHDKYLRSDLGIDVLMEEIEKNIKSFFSHINIKGLSDETKRFYRNNLEFIVENITSVKELNRRLENPDDFIKSLIKIAGLLIRIDHAASGDGMVIEEKPIKKKRERLFIEYLLNKSKNKTGERISLRPFQKKFKDYENLVLVADTGLGKTGLAVLWSKRKFFYVLPNRTSTNAMYNTLKEIFGKDSVGLLHSNSLFYLLDNGDADDYKTLTDHDNIRNFSKPVTVTTADQLFTAVFKYPTYEKIYATMMYSDVVIDEIQSFDPAQIVPMLKQIKETKQLGTRYLIITATLPKIIKEEFEKLGFSVVTADKDTIDKTKRHKVEIIDKNIFEVLDVIVTNAKSGKKILVVVNNVPTAQEVYKKLKRTYHKTKLIHSRFTWKDRRLKESEIDSDSKNSESVIWVATQIVEVSLDIDFDVLFTEAAVADSLIQRMGRVWRHRKSDYYGEPNVYIVSKVDEKRVKEVYELKLVNESLKLIKNFLQPDGFLLSTDKRKIVEILYSKETLKKLNSNYLRDWEKAEKILDSGWDFLLKKEAQLVFRNVLSIEVVPREFTKDVESYLNRMEEIKEIPDKRQRRLEKLQVLKRINDLKVPVPLYWLIRTDGKLHLNPEIGQILSKELGLIVLGDCFKYSSDVGLEFDKERCKYLMKISEFIE